MLYSHTTRGELLANHTESHEPVDAADQCHAVLCCYRYKTSTEAALSYDQAARLINALEEPAVGSSDAQFKKRNRQLNFPDLYPNDQAVLERIMSIISAVAPEAAQSLEAAAAAAAAAAGAAAAHTSAGVLEGAAAADDADDAAQAAEGAETGAAHAQDGISAAAAHALNDTFAPAAPARTSSRSRGTPNASSTPAYADTPAVDSAAAMQVDVSEDAPAAEAAGARKAPYTRRASKPPLKSNRRSASFPGNSDKAAEGTTGCVSAPAGIAALDPFAAAADAAGAAFTETEGIFGQSRTAHMGAAAAAEAGAAAAHLKPPAWPVRQSMPQQQQWAQTHQPGAADGNKPSAHRQLLAAPPPTGAAGHNDFLNSRDWDDLMSLIGEGDSLPADALQGLPSLLPPGAHPSAMQGAGPGLQATAADGRAVLQEAGSAELQDSSDSSRPATIGAPASLVKQQQDTLQVRDQPQSLEREMALRANSYPGVVPPTSRFGSISMHHEAGMQGAAAARVGSNSSSNAKHPAAAFEAAADCWQRQAPNSMMMYANTAPADGNSNMMVGGHHGDPHGGVAATEQQLLPPPLPVHVSSAAQQRLAPPRAMFMGFNSARQHVPGPDMHHQEQQVSKASLQPPTLLPFTSCCKPSTNQLSFAPTPGNSQVPLGTFAGFAAAEAQVQGGWGAGAGADPGFSRAGSFAGASWMEVIPEPAPWPESGLAAASNAAAAAAAPRDVPGMQGTPAVGPAHPGAGAAPAAADGLFAGIVGPAQAMAVFDSCLHALSDLEVHMSQQPAHAGSAVGSLLDWTNAAWHREVVTNQAVPLTAGPAVVAAAVAGAKAQPVSAAQSSQLALLLLDKLVLLVVQALTQLHADVPLQRAFVLELLTHLREGFAEGQDVMAAAGAQAGACREFFGHWVANRAGACSSPAIAGVLSELFHQL